MAKRKGYDHTKLGITFQELGALLGVRALLESGTLPHMAPGRKYSVQCGLSASAHEFSMRFAMVQKGCGTLGCIGGTMALIMGRHESDYVSNSLGALWALFPRVGAVSLDDWWDRITSQVAVAAIDAFLAGKEPNWKALIEKHGLTEKELKTKQRAWDRRCELLGY